MGDRGNIVIHYPGEQKIYFYTHWTGSELPQIVAAGLERGRSRWDDLQYLPRILFSELIKDAVLDTTGYGISPEQGDGGTEVHVDLEQQLVWTEGVRTAKATFKQWIETAGRFDG